MPPTLPAPRSAACSSVRCSQLTDAPTAVLATAAAAAAGALLFATAAGRDVQTGGRGLSVARGRLRLCAPALAVVLTVVAGAHAAAARHNASWLRLVWVKGQYEARPLVERWNSFSRIRVIGNPDECGASRPGGA